MAKTKNFVVRQNASDFIEKRRSMLFSRYMEKYRILWMGAYKWEGLPLATAQYVMRKFWEVGTVACFSYDLPGSVLLDFLPWSMQDYNSHHDPSRILLLNENNAKAVPTEKLEVVYGDDQLGDANTNKKAVIGFAQSNKEPIIRLVADYVSLVVDVEMTINTALIATKQPFLISVGPDSRERTDDLLKRLMNDDPILFTNGEELKGFINGSPYIVDKLYQFKTQRENELLTYLGIDNAPIQKKERETIDEANSNNDIINDHAEGINENLEEFINLINKTFGVAYKISARHSMSESVHESTPKKEEENNDGNDN